MTVDNRPPADTGPDTAGALVRFEDLVTTIEAAKTRAARLDGWAGLAGSDLAELLPFVALDHPRPVERLLLRLERVAGLSGKVAGLRRSLAQTAAGSQAQATPIYEPPPGAPVEAPEGAVIPRGYALTADGTWREWIRQSGRRARVEWIRVVHLPVAVLGVAQDVGGGGHAVRLAWSRTGEAWRERIVAQTIALSVRDVVQLAGEGLTVSSDSARELVAYLESAIASVRSEPTRTSRACGWVAGGFLVGARYYGPDGEVLPPPVTLDVSDAGMAERARGYGQAGTWEGWCAAAALCRPHPYLALTLAVALVPPLIKLIPGARNVILDLHGTTSLGKTTAMRVGASAWGLPDDGEGGIIATWESTKTWAERAAQSASDLPLFLDDSKRANPAEVSKLVYSIAQGRGKGRGTVGGTQATATWRTAAISTGESALSSYSEDGGAAARILALSGSPLGGRSPEAGALSRTLKRELLANHGHAGPRLVSWLQGEGRAAQVRAWYDAELEAITAHTGSDAVAGRAAESMALVCVAVRCALTIGVPDLGNGARDAAWTALLGASAAADKAARALRDVYAWAAARQGDFYGRESSGRAPSSWLGSWDTYAGWERISILTRSLREQLVAMRYDAEAVLHEWSDRGWLIRGKDEIAVRASVGGVKASVYAIRRDALVAVGATE